jgi:N-acetylmuramoyl-L-alanine amidase
LPSLRAIIAACVASLLPLWLAPIEMSHAVPSRKIVRAKPRPNPKPAPEKCEPAKFRIVVDVGHTAEALGADSARNDPEFAFNLRLARLVAEKLKSEGFATTRLLVTEGRARPSLFKRVNAANDWRVDLFLSIHHDAVPDKFLEEWEFEGARSHFSDRFSGHSLFVSRQNPRYAASLAFARLLGRKLKTQDLTYAHQYTLPMMGRYRHELLDKDVGVYRFDQLVVLSRTKSAAVLLEAGSIINRDEEMAMNSPERQQVIATAVAAAMKEFCEKR